MSELVTGLLLVLSFLSCVRTECEFNLGVYEYEDGKMIIQGDLLGTKHEEEHHSMFLKISLECQNQVSIYNY